MINFLIWQISRFMFYFFHIIQSMRQVCLKSQFSFCICFPGFDQGILFHDHFIICIQDIFLCIKSKGYSLKRFACNSILFQNFDSNMLSFIDQIHCDIINRNFLSIVFDFKFLCFRIKNTVLSCFFFNQIIFSNRKVVQDRFPICTCNQCCNQIIFIVSYNTITFCIRLSVRCINGLLCIDCKFCALDSSHFIGELIARRYIHSFFTGNKFRYRIYYRCNAVFYF